MPFVIGLTGGIGSGKTTAAALFAQLGAEVIDTDEIARALTQPGGGALELIRQAFGSEFIGPDGTLDRPRMRHQVFSDPAARSRLEAILHPLIRERARSRAAASRAPYVLLVVPLLVEKGGYRGYLQRVLVVDCDEELQLARTMERSRLTREEVLAIMASQASREARLKQADDVLHNDGDLEHLKRQVQRLHCKYLEFAAAAPPSGPG